MRYHIIATFALLISGCATTPVPIAEATAIPKSKQFSYTQSSASTGTIIVVRDSGWNTSACDTHISIDGRLAAHVGTGEKAILYVPPGEVIVGAVAGGICAGGLIEREAKVVAGQTILFRISYGTHGEFGLHRTIGR